MVDPRIDRDLAFKDRSTDFLESNINEAVGRVVADELALSNERQFLVLEISGEEFTQLFASVYLGAAILYAPNSDGVLWNLWKAATVGTFCAAVNACVAAGGGGGGGGAPDAPIPESERQKDRAPDGWTCDKDHAFGMARAIIEAIHDAFVEFLEQIELATNPLELATELSDNIPIGAVAASAGEILNWIQDTIGEIYNAAWSDTIRDELACELMCKMLVSCTITYDDVYDLYSEGIAGLPTYNSSWWEWIDWLFALSPSANKDIVKQGGLLGLIAMRFGGKFMDLFELGIYSFDTIVKLNANTSSSDWSALCDACPEDHPRLGGDGNTDMVSLAFGGNNAATYDSGADRYVGVHNPAGDAIVSQIQFDLLSSHTITAVRMVATTRRTRASGGDNLLTLVIDGNQIEAWVIPSVEGVPTEHILSWEGTETGQVVEFLAGISTINNQLGQLDLDKMDVSAV